MKFLLILFVVWGIVYYWQQSRKPKEFKAFDASDKEDDGQADPLTQIFFGLWAALKRSAQNGVLWLVAGIGSVMVGLAFLIQYTLEMPTAVALKASAISKGTQAASAVSSAAASLEVRFIVTGILMLAMLMTGWFLRNKRRLYALILQGGAIGIFYMTLFAASVVYGLLPLVPAFALLALVTACATVLALKQDAEPLACCATLGGFIAPVLVGGEGLSHPVLFAYYGLLNVGIVWASRYKAWRNLNLTGFVSTFIFSVIWCAFSFPADNLGGTVFFIVLFFLGYTGIAVQQILRGSFSTENPLDVLLAFGTPIALCSLLLPMARYQGEFYLALSSFSLGAFYVLLGFFFSGRAGRGLLKKELKWIVPACLGAGVVFANLALPLALTFKVLAGVWGVQGLLLLLCGLKTGNRYLLGLGIAGVAFFNAALPIVTAVRGSAWVYLTEGAVVCLVGMRIKNMKLTLAGALAVVILVMSLQYLYSWPWIYFALLVLGVPVYGLGAKKERVELRLIGGALHLLGLLYFLHPAYRGGAFATNPLGLSLTFGGAALCCSLIGGRVAKTSDRASSESLLIECRVFFVWALLWLFPSGFRLIFSTVSYSPEVVLIVLTLTGVGSLLMAEVIGWKPAQLPAFLPPLAAFFFLLQALWQGNGLFPLIELLYFRNGHALAGLGALAWPLYFGGQYLTVRRIPLLKVFHVGAKAAWERALAFLRVGNFVLFFVLLISEYGFVFSRLMPGVNSYWIDLVVVAMLASGLMALAGENPPLLARFPERQSEVALLGGGVLAVLLSFWAVCTFSLAGDSYPLSFMPLLNPLAFAELLTFLAVTYWHIKMAGRYAEFGKLFSGRVAIAVCTVLAMAWSTVETARIFHFWGGTPFSFPGLWQNLTFQTCVTLLWGLWSLGMMVVGSRKLHHRRLWNIGAVLLSLNILKLMLADLSGTGTLTRICSFIGLGILMMVIGYLAPLPQEGQSAAA